MDVPVIDCFAAHTRAMNGGVTVGHLFSDGVHYSAAGYDVRLSAEPMLTVPVYKFIIARGDGDCLS
jgi:hypothetical protein